MSTHTIADAKERLAELIDRARSGEDVLITEGGEPVATLKPVAETLQPLSDADIEWLRDHRVGAKEAAVDAATLVREIRDEGPA